MIVGSLIQHSDYSAHTKSEQVVLEPTQREEAALFKDVGKQLKKTWLDISPGGDPTIKFEHVLDASGIKTTQHEPSLRQIAERIEQVYAGQPHWRVNAELSAIPNMKAKNLRVRRNTILHMVLGRLGIVSGGQAPSLRPIQPSGRGRRVKAKPNVRAKQEVSTVIRKMKTKQKSQTPPPATRPELTKVAQVNDYQLKPISAITPEVPRLSFDLSRVLFNPGVYQLQDPRSRVWNFDPYLGKIIPVSEFNFDALNKYITSSEDDNLREIALQHGSRYTGSTSSMSGMLSHFHFLLSAFRALTIHNMSRGFGEEYSSFTKLQRGPSAIFLRWRNGTYAVDADKEFDSANILMSVGRSMEKLFTSEKKDFELYRKTAESDKNALPQSQEGESYHYTQLGQFLLRSQLDCFDPRLPGTGVFDLKTRAVAGVRMMLSKPEEGQGYQIKERFGTWESYEREYYDMMRAAFLKYSLQVRMGRMDGIFVAYHNVERLFGFQYISLPEMDLALHGQTDPTLGDQEFRLSFRILNDIFDRATAAYPETSIRFHFETREATKANAPSMYVFAEPVSEDEIRTIQTAKKSEIESYERRLFNPPQASKSGLPGGADAPQATAGNEVSSHDDLAPMAQGEDPADGSGQHTYAEDIAFLENMMGVSSTAEIPPNQRSSKSGSGDSSKVQDKRILAWKLAIQNSVNGKVVLRPTSLQSSDSWVVNYSLEPQSQAMGQRNYTLCKNRRKAALEFPQDEDVAAGYYIQQLIDLSREGAQWRRELDELDSQRERVVLYEEKR